MRIPSTSIMSRTPRTSPDVISGPLTLGPASAPARGAILGGLAPARRILAPPAVGGQADESWRPGRDAVASGGDRANPGRRPDRLAETGPARACDGSDGHRDAPRPRRLRTAAAVSPPVVDPRRSGRRARSGSRRALYRDRRNGGPGRLHRWPRLGVGSTRGHARAGRLAGDEPPAGAGAAGRGAGRSAGVLVPPPRSRGALAMVAARGAPHAGAPERDQGAASSRALLSRTRCVCLGPAGAPRRAAGARQLAVRGRRAGRHARP